MKKKLMRNLVIAGFMAGGLLFVGSNLSAGNGTISNPGFPGPCASIYNVTYSAGMWPPNISIDCSTGGAYKCPLFAAICN